MKLPDLPFLRELNRDDEQEVNLVLAGWLRTYVGTQEKPSSVHLTMERGVMFRLYQPVVKSILERANVVMACLPEEHGVVFGWVAFEGSTLHYVCVKPRWQRLGIASYLLRDFAELDTVYTHRTANGLRLPVARKWEYKPMARFADEPTRLPLRKAMATV